MVLTNNNQLYLRNVPDDVLQMVAEKGGIVMVNFFPYFLTDDYPARNATVQVEKMASCRDVVVNIYTFPGCGGAHQPYQSSSRSGACGNR